MSTLERDQDVCCSILLDSGLTIWYVIRNSGYACNSVTVINQWSQTRNKSTATCIDFSEISAWNDTILLNSVKCTQRYSAFVIGCLPVVCDASVLWQNCKQDHTVFTAKQLKVSTVSMVSLKSKFEGGPLDWGLKLGWGGLWLCDATTSLKQCKIELDPKAVA